MTRTKEMEVGYLKKVLRAALGPTRPDENQSHLQDSQPAFIRLQEPVGSRVYFDSTFGNEGYESGTPGGEIISHEIPGGSSSFEQLGTMIDPLSGSEQKDGLNSPVRKPTIKKSREKGIEIDIHGKSEQDLSKPHTKMPKIEQGIDQLALKHIEEQVKSESETFDLKESGRVPKVEVIGEGAIRLSRSDQPDPPPSSYLLSERKDESPKSTESKKGLTARKATIEKQAQPVQQKISVFKDTIDEQNQERRHRDTSLLTKSPRKAKIQAARESQPEQSLYDYVRPLPQESKRVEMKSAATIEEQKNGDRSKTSVHTLNAMDRHASAHSIDPPFFTENPQETEKQLSQIIKKCATLKKKVEDHIRQEEQRRQRPNFLPKRPPSHNLGGWSNLERNFIK